MNLSLVPKSFNELCIFSSSLSELISAAHLPSPLSLSPCPVINMYGGGVAGGSWELGGVLRTKEASADNEGRGEDEAAGPWGWGPAPGLQTRSED